MHQLRRLTLAALILLSAPLAAQDEDWYQVELLVFDRSDLKPGLESEHWPPDPGWPPLAQALDLLPPGTAGESGGERAYPLVDALYHHLGEPATRLDQHPGYRLLAHLAWIQSAAPRAPTLPALITDPDDPERYQPLTYLPPYEDEQAAPEPETTAPEAPAPFGQDEILVEPLPAPDALPPGTLPATPVESSASDGTEENPSTTGIHLVSSMGPPQRRLFGTVRLRRGRFLHLDLDLLLRPEPERLPAPEATGETTPADTPLADPSPAQPTETTSQPPDYLAVEGFRLHQSRRVRPGEIHYFDHPLYGVIAVVEKLEPPAAPPSEETAEDTPAPP